MDFKTQGATIEPGLHPLWAPLLRPASPPKRKRRRKRKPKAQIPRWVSPPIPAGVASHIVGQQEAIYTLHDMLVLIIEALDRDDADRAMAIASETVAELRRVLTVH